MHLYRSHIVKNVSAIALLFFLLLPTVVNFVHSAEGHDHSDRCENKSDTHVHEKKVDCCLCDVTLQNNGVFTPTKDIVFISYQDFPEKTTHTQTISLSVYRITESRGPPTC